MTGIWYLSVMTVIELVLKCVLIDMSHLQLPLISHPRAGRTKSHCRGIGTPFLWLVAKILSVWINPGGTLGNILSTVTLWMLSTKKRFFSVGRSLEMNWVLSEEHTQEEKWSFLKVPRQCPVPQEGGEERLWMGSLISGDPFSSVSLHWETRQTVHCEHNSVALGFFRNSYFFTTYCVFMYALVKFPHC